MASQSAVQLRAPGWNPWVVHDSVPKSCPSQASSGSLVPSPQIPEQPASLDYQTIAENRESWIQAWDETVLR